MQSFPLHSEVCFVCLSLLVMMSSLTEFDIILLFDGRPQVSSALYFKHNTALGPPYRVLVDTNFINFSIQNKVSDANVLVFIILVFSMLDAGLPSVGRSGMKFRFWSIGGIVAFINCS